MRYAVRLSGVVFVVVMVWLMISACSRQGAGVVQVVFQDSSLFNGEGADSLRLELFDTLWSDVNHRYVYLGAGANTWTAACDSFRVLIRPSMNTREFRNLLSDMLFELEDENLALVDSLGTVFDRHIPERAVNWQRKAWDTTVEQLQYTDVKGWGYANADTVGYFFFFNFDPETFEPAVFDSVMGTMSEMRAIVFDVRYMGHQATSLTVPALTAADNSILSDDIIGWFLTGDTPVLGRITRVHPDPSTITLGPHGGTPFTGDIVVLIGQGTLDEGELFAAALKQLSQTILIGDSTPGIAGATETYPLSSGWSYAIPEIGYTYVDGTPIHGNGLIPDVEIPWSNVDFNHSDYVLLEALRWLNDFLD